MFFKKKKEEIKEKYIVVDCAFNCPKKPLEEGGCPKWLVMEQTVTIEGTNEVKKIQVGKCAIAWIPYLMIELFKKENNALHKK